MKPDLFLSLRPWRAFEATIPFGENAISLIFSERSGIDSMSEKFGEAADRVIIPRLQIRFHKNLSSQ